MIKNQYVGLHTFFKKCVCYGTIFSFQALSQGSFYLCCGAKPVYSERKDSNFLLGIETENFKFSSYFEKVDCFQSLLIEININSLSL